MLFDWCRPINSKTWINYILHYLVMTIVFIILLLLTIFYTTQLTIDFVHMTIVHEIIPNVMWLMAFSFALYINIFYNWKRNELLSFFKRWDQLENRLSKNVSLVSKPKRISLFMFTSYAVMTCGTMVGVWNKMNSKPNDSTLLSHYELLRDVFTIPLILSFHFIGILIKWILFSLCDLVPGMIFYCAGKALHSIEQELIDHFHSSIPSKVVSQFRIHLRRTWFKYESVLDLVGEVNRIFGAMMFFDHGIKFFLICTLTFTSLSGFKEPNLDTMASASAALTFIFRLVACLLLASQLNKSSRELKATASLLLSRNYHQLRKEERDDFVLFLGRLHSHPLAARPLGLYCIETSILLTVLGLTISYVIVLVQL